MWKSFKSFLCSLCFLSFFVLLETQLNSFFRSVTHSLHLVSQDSHQLENSTEVKKKCLDGHWWTLLVMSKSIQHFQCEHTSTELILVTVSAFLKTSLKVVVDFTPHRTSIQQDVNFGTETLNLPGKG